MAAIEIEIEGKTVKLGGACKGSGMICPNMATLLAMVTCDAPIEQDTFKRMLHEVTARTFNMVNRNN